MKAKQIGNLIEIQTDSGPNRFKLKDAPKIIEALWDIIISNHNFDKYQIIIKKEFEEDGDFYWRAALQEFPLCDTSGDTPQEAVDSLRRVFGDLVVYFTEEGKKIPKPLQILKQENK